MHVLGFHVVFSLVALSGWSIELVLRVLQYFSGIVLFD